MNRFRPAVFVLAAVLLLLLVEPWALSVVAVESAPDEAIPDSPEVLAEPDEPETLTEPDELETPAEPAPPGPPTGLSVTDPGTGGELSLSWDEVAEADGIRYSIYRDVAPGGAFPEIANGIVHTTYTDSGLANGATYYYRITASDADGNESEPTEPVEGFPSDTTPPEAPSDLGIVDLFTGTDVNLNWTENTTDGDLTGYNLYRATSAAGPFSQINASLLDRTTISYPERGLPRDQSFWYSITAVDETGNESIPAYTTTVTPVDLTPPREPILLGVSNPGNGRELIASWLPNTEEDHAGYNLYRMTTPIGASQKLNSSLIALTTFWDLGGAIGTQYWYQLSAVDRYGNESAVSEPAHGTPTDRVPPSPPAMVTVTNPGSGGTLLVEWSLSPEADTAGYNLWYSTRHDGPYLKASPALLNHQPFQHDGLADEKPVYYRISAVDSYGNESAQTPSGGSVGVPSDLNPPRVILTSPSGGEPGFPTAGLFTVTFDQPADPASITAGVFSVTPAGGAPVSPAAYAYAISTRTATFTMPQLLPKKGYTATLASSVRNTSGITMGTPYTWSFTTGSTAYVTPHGNFLSDTKNCATCHRTHTGRGPSVATRINETAVCFYCHDGTQAQTNIAQDFAEGSGHISRHPVSDTPSVQTGLIRCSDCHNPHGDKKPDGSLYPNLLRARTAASGASHQGNEFCLACHGSSGFSPTYYAETAGDHTNPSAVHGGGYSDLQPASGTQIACIQCHNQHAAPAERLLKAAEEALCFSCHNTGLNSMNGRNVAAEFGQAAVHSVTGSTGGNLECSSCHGPHTVARADYTTGSALSQLSNPKNTKEDFAGVSGSTSSYMRSTEFCLACHGGFLPQATADADTLVPHSILFPGQRLTTNAGAGGPDDTQRGWDKSDYTSSVHFSQGIGCSECHNSHGSPYPELLTRGEDTAAAGAQGICGKCHDGNPPAPYASAPNVFADLTRSGLLSPDQYRHPTLYVGDRHGNTEEYSLINRSEPGNERHAACMDCHDPHSSRRYESTRAPIPTGPVRNVSGVSVAYGSVTWDTWDPGSNSPFMTLANPIRNQYELCLKCHTYYSWKENPPVPSGKTPHTDIARDFNPNNPSYHAVIGESKIGTFTYNDQPYPYGKFTAPTTDSATRDSAGEPWSATSRLYCEDCHSSGESGKRSPHGSSNLNILRDRFERYPGPDGKAGTGSPGTSGDLCFSCHDYGFYAGGYRGSPSERSAFSGPDSYNLHGNHSGTGCTACHVTVVHGWKIKGLLANRSSAFDPAIPGSGGDPTAPSPYYDGSLLSISTWKMPGNWMKTDCGSCHSN